MKKSIFLVMMIFIIISLSGYVNKYPLDSDYHTEKEIIQKLKQWKSEYPDLFSSEILGYTKNGKSAIRSFKISKNVKHKRFNKASILIIGQIHSSEPIGVEICMNLAEYLLINHSEESVDEILESFNIFFIPSINPDGFKIVSSGQYANHRKNTTDTNKNGKLDKGIDGVDINRNFPINWNKEEQYKVHEPYFAGTSAGSETETKIMMDFMKRERFLFTVNYHSSYIGDYNELIFYPWNWKEGKSPHWEEMNYLASYLSKFLKKDYSKENYIVHSGITSKVGFFRDWAYSETGTLFFDIEVGGIYKKKSIIFPNNFMLKQIVEKNVKSVIEMLNHLKENTFALQLFHQKNEHRRFKEIHHKSMNHPNLKGKISNEEGFVFIYVPPYKKSMSLYIDQKRYTFSRKDMNKTRYLQIKS